MRHDEAKEAGFTGPPVYPKDQSIAEDGPHHGTKKKGDTIVPDYERCIAIATTAAIKEMVIPGALAVFMPVIIGFVLTSKGLAGCLIGSLATRVALLNAAELYDPRVRVSREREERPVVDPELFRAADGLEALDELRRAGSILDSGVHCTVLQERATYGGRRRRRRRRRRHGA